VTRKKLIARLDKVFSQWVRMRTADHRGFVECYTCGKVAHWKTVDAGHFQSRAKFSTRWMCDPEEGMVNVAPQCKSCNGFRSGEQFKFARRLDAEFGEGTAETIEQASNQTRKYSVEELEALIDVYNRRLRKL
jgi:hypothetical protein